MTTTQRQTGTGGRSLIGTVLAIGVRAAIGGYLLLSLSLLLGLTERWIRVVHPPMGAQQMASADA